MRLRRRPLLRTAVAALASCAALGSGVLVTPTPARAADTVRGLQWYLDTLRIPQAHKLSKGRGVKVAVVDSGVDVTRPDLEGQVLSGHGVSADAAPDGRRDSDPETGHGTWMSGIIAGRGGGVNRELGIAPESKILPVSYGRSESSRDIAAGIRWAVDAGADVVNLSVGAPGPAAESMSSAVRYALDKDVVVVASVGNVKQGDTAVISPANIPGVVAVSGLGKDGAFFPGSVKGPETVLAAPQEKIIGPVPLSVSRNGYGVGSGTSQAAAIVSGVVALVRARYPDLDAANVINRLIRTARDNGAPGRDDQYGFGAVDPVGALTAKVPAVTANPLLGAAPSNSSGPERTAADDDDGPPISIGVTNKVGAAIQAGFCLGVPLVAVVVVILVRRRSRRRAAAGPPVPPVGPPRMPPPPGWPGQPGCGPPPGASYGPQPQPVAYPGHGGPGAAAGPHAQPAAPPGYGPPAAPPGYGPPPGQAAPSGPVPPPAGFPTYGPPPSGSGGPPAPPPPGAGQPRQ